MANPNTAIFPGAVSVDNNLPVITDNAFSPLASSINNSVTNIPFVTNTVFTLPCLIALENEIILAEGPISGSNITNCQRGYLGSAAGHTGGVVGYGYIFGYNINQLSAEIKAIETALGASMANVLQPSSAVGGDLSGTLPDPTVATVGGAAAAAIASAASLKHTQNTDTGTNSSTFQVGTGGVKIKNIGTALQARNSSDSGFTDMQVAAIVTNTTLTGGDLTGNLPGATLVTTGVTPTTYGDGSHVAQIVVDAKGRITSASSVSITSAGSAAPSGSAGGDLAGTYPNPTLGTSGVTAATYGDSSHVPVFAVDVKGRVTSVTNTAITFGSAGGDLAGTFPNPTVATVGGAAAADIATVTTLGLAATASNTVSTLVERNSNGDFAARNITARLIGPTGTPTKAAGTGAGTTPTTSIVGTDLSGKITVTTGTGPATSGDILVVTFNAALAAAPNSVILEPGNAAAAALTTASPFITTLATTGFTVESNAVALAASTTYIWYYAVLA